MKRSLVPALVLALAWCSPQARADTPAGPWEFTADAGLAWRYFPREPAYRGQSAHDGLSAAFNAQARWRSGDERQRINIQPFLRLDGTDSERSHFDLREAYWAIEGEGWELLAGFNKVFWGVTESRHLVDVINQTDLVEDPDQEQKLGQPMIRGLWQGGLGQLELFVMPWFRERTFPGVEGRLRPALPVDSEHSLYESPAGRHHTDLALRWSHYFGDLDIGVSAFRGTGREPAFLQAGDRLVPLYHQISQLGVDLQYTREAWLWKLEFLARDGLQDRFAAAVAGFEYTFFGVRNSAVDVGLLVEYLYDGRAPGEPPTPFADDVFLGTRLALNDAMDTALLAGVIVDRTDSERFFNLEAERRFGASLFGELRVRLFHSGGEPDGLQAYSRDDYVELRLSRYF